MRVLLILCVFFGLIGIHSAALAQAPAQAGANAANRQCADTPEDCPELAFARGLSTLFSGSAHADQDLGKATAKRLAEKGLSMGNPAFIRIFKEEMLLELWLAPNGADKEFKLFAVYPICAMSGDLGPKLKRGDMQAPEGFYSVGLKALNPHSSYHLSFNLGYPNAYDRAHGRTGDYLMVHGNCVSAGCFAMTDLYITEIYKIVESGLKSGQPFFRTHIFPFRMTEENFRRHASSRWTEFWRMLKPGYDYFEKHKIPPDIAVKNKQYVLSDKKPK